MSWVCASYCKQRWRAACVTSSRAMSSAARALSSDCGPLPNRPDVESSKANLSAPPGFAVATLRQVLPPAPLQRPESPRGSRPEPSPQRRTARPRSRVQRSSRAKPTSQPSNSRSRSAARVAAVLGPGGPPAMVMPPGPSILAVPWSGWAASALAAPPGPAYTTPDSRPEHLYVHPRYALQRASWAVAAAEECARAATLRDSTRRAAAEALGIAREAIKEALTYI
jgi:hypothetical protein